MHILNELIIINEFISKTWNLKKKSNFFSCTCTVDMYIIVFGISKYVYNVQH